MNITRQRLRALSTALLAFAALSAQAAPTSKSAAIDTNAAQQERAARLAFLEKQKALAEERGVAVDAPARASSTIVDMPQDEADAPGAVKK